jgi:hypothetical protein
VENACLARSLQPRVDDRGLAIVPGSGLRDIAGYVLSQEGDDDVAVTPSRGIGSAGQRPRTEQEGAAAAGHHELAGIEERLGLETPQQSPLEQRPPIPDLSGFLVAFLHRQPHHSIEEGVEDQIRFHREGDGQPRDLPPM